MSRTYSVKIDTNLVDVVGDDDYTHSRFIEFERPESAATKPTVDVTIRGGLVQDVHATHPVSVFIVA